VNSALLISVRALNKTFEVGLRGCTARARALVDLQLDIARREIVGVVGHAGAGKTTLLRSLAGLLAGDSGIIERAAMAEDDVARVVYLHDPLELSRFLAGGDRWDIAAVDNADGVLGDVSGSFAILAAARHARSVGGAMILAARDERAIASIADRLIVLERGRVRDGRSGASIAVTRVAEATSSSSR
jgi:ABC-type glutathione transport system ATPase component